MKYHCVYCNYNGRDNHDLQKHNKTKKHTDNIKPVDFSKKQVGLWDGKIQHTCASHSVLLWDKHFQMLV